MAARHEGPSLIFDTYVLRANARAFRLHLPPGHTGDIVCAGACVPWLLGCREWGWSSRYFAKRKECCLSEDAHGRLAYILNYFVFFFTAKHCERSPLVNPVIPVLLLMCRVRRGLVEEVLLLT